MKFAMWIFVPSEVAALQGDECGVDKHGQWVDDNGDDRPTRHWHRDEILVLNSLEQVDAMVDQPLQLVLEMRQVLRVFWAFTIHLEVGLGAQLHCKWVRRLGVRTIGDLDD